MSSTYKDFFKRNIAMIIALTLFIGASIVVAAEQPQDTGQDEVSQVFTDEELDRILAPIALYPDAVLTHILIASTYPLEVVQLARWREANSRLSEQQVSAAVEDKDWDPSVKALAPFTELLESMSDDLDWLESLGNAVLADQEQVMDRIQILRHMARDAGHLDDNDYVRVEKEEDDTIVIQPTRREVVYVPYYDTRVVYGPWWHPHDPYYWHHPAHFTWNLGFYWSRNFYVGSGFYFGGFHWSNRHLLVDYRWRNLHRHTPVHLPHSVIGKRKYLHWRHDIRHRHGVRYPHGIHRRHFIHKDSRSLRQKFSAHSERRKPERHLNHHRGRERRDFTHNRNHRDRQFEQRRNNFNQRYVEQRRDFEQRRQLDQQRHIEHRRQVEQRFRQERNATVHRQRPEQQVNRSVQNDRNRKGGDFRASKFADRSAASNHNRKGGDFRASKFDNRPNTSSRNRKGGDFRASKHPNRAARADHGRRSSFRASNQSSRSFRGGGERSGGRTHPSGRQ